MNEPVRIEIDLYNSSSSPKRIWFEPWAEELMLPPSIGWRLVCASEEMLPITVDFNEDLVTIWGIRRSTLMVFEGDRKIWESYAPFDPPNG